MRFNPGNTRHINQLEKAATFSFQAMQTARENRKKAKEQYHGPRYAGGAVEDHSPLNLFQMAVMIYVRRLAAREPKASVTSKFQQLARHSSLVQLATNRLITEIGLKIELQRLVMDGLFSFGIARSGIHGMDEEGFESPLDDPGQFFVRRIDINDFLQDMTVSSLDAATFMGNYYWRPLSYVKNGDRFDEKLTNELSADDVGTTAAGDEPDSTAAGRGSMMETIEDRIRLLDIFIPQGNLLLTFPAQNFGDKPIAVRELQGPEEHPYTILSYGDVPNEPLPLAPLDLLFDLHDLANMLFLKVSDQAVKQKTVGYGQAGNDRDAHRVINAGDGDFIPLTNPNAVGQMKFGGADQQTLGLLLYVQEQFSKLAGNLDVLGGLGAQSPTATQDTLLAENASLRIQDMQDRTVDFTKKLIQKAGFYLMTDPLIDLELLKRSPNNLTQTTVRYTPEMREGDFWQHNFDVVPHSMQDQTPAEKIQTLRGIWQTFVMPMIPLMQQQGETVDLRELFKTLSELANLPELESMLSIRPAPGEPGPIGQPPPQSPITHRINERISRPGASRGGNEQIMMQALFGGNPQPAEKAAVARGAA